MDRALETLADLAQARQLVNETTQLVERLTGALASPNRVAIFADLRRQLERSTQLHNRITRVRRGLLATEGGTGELAEVRRQRRELERYLDNMPTTDEEIAAVITYVRGQKEWGNKASEVTPERVKAVREKEKARTQSWTAEELKKINPAD